MADFDKDETFYEEDEPAEKIHSAFEAGDKGVTAPPVTWHFVTESVNSGLVAYTPITPNWITAGQQSNSGIPIPG